MKDNGTDQKALAVCFGQFGPYHHARVAALQHVGREHGAGGMARWNRLRLPRAEEHGVKAWLKTASRVFETGLLFKAN